MLRETYQEYLWPSLIPVDTRFREASRAGIPPALFDPRSRGVLAYAQLLEYLEQGADRVAGGAA